MIRLAFLGVLALAGLLAFGAFYLAKGSEGEPTQITTGTPEGPSPAPEAPATPEVEMLFFLRGIDFDMGEITLVLFQAGPDQDRIIIRDQAALIAAKDSAYVNTTTPTGEAAGSLLSVMVDTPPDEAIAHIYRDDVLIAVVTCPQTACGNASDSSDIDYAGLTDFALPYQTISDELSSHDAYLETIQGVASDPNYMLLDLRPHVDFPLPPRAAHLIIDLPTVATQDAAFDPSLHEALVQAAATPLLPDGASLDWVRLSDPSTAILADKDNNQPVLVDGAPVPFPATQFYGVRARITGLTSLAPEIYTALSEATMNQTDIDTAFPDFVTTNLATTCVDCYFLQLEGDFLDTARAFDWRAESYYLNYYDLREAP